MRIYAEFDHAGLPVGFYSEEFHGERLIAGEDGIEVANPHCGIPLAAIEISADDYAAFLKNQGAKRWDGVAVVDYAPDQPTPVIGDYKSAFDSLLDAVAQEMSYDNRFSPPSYLASTNAQWAAEAAVYVEWRDRAMEYMFATLLEFQSGEAQPTVEEFIAGVPKIEWPISE